MMGIAQKVARNFSDAVRARGQSYFSKGRVSLMSAKPNEVVARVRGTTKYRVRARLRGARLLATCSCPYFGPQGEPCKHLWATLLLADSRGFLQSPPNMAVRLVAEPPRRAPGSAPSPGPGVEPGEDRPRPGPIPPSGPSPGPGLEGPNGLNPDYGRDVIIGAPRHPASQVPSRPARGRNATGKDRRPPPARARERNGERPPPPSPPDGPSGVWTPASAREARAARNKARREADAAGRAGPKAVNRNAKRLLVYVLDVAATQAHNQIVIDLARRQRKPTGEWGPLRPWWYAPKAAHVKYDPEDRLLLALLDEAHHGVAAPAPAAALANAQGPADESRPGQAPPPPRAHRNAAADLRGTRRFILRKDQAALVERLARSGRLRLRRTDGEDEPPTMRWDDGLPWRFALDIRAEAGGKRWSWRGGLRRGDNRMDLAEPLVLLPGLLVLGVGRAARFDDLGVMTWIVRLRYEKEITFVEPQQDLMLGRILAEARVPAVELVDSLALEEIVAKPRPSLTLRTPRQNWGLAADKLLAELEFDYDGAVIPAGRTTPLAVSTELGLVIRRDPRTESAADVKLFELGFREAKDPRLDPNTLELPAKRMDAVAKELVLAGWRIEAEGKLIRPAGEFKLALSTGIDWFDLDGGVDYGGQSVSLPELLSAAKRGDTMIELGDGSMGMLPEDWLKKYGLLADLGAAENGALRFNASQAGLLDALLENQPEIQIDEAFARVRKNLRQFDGVVALDSPPGFHGELRAYQREGLGWLDYLQRFGFGGILADDMGLGKTIQVLALLQRRRFRRQAKGPTLAVVPRSLVFNWLAEAEKFTPRLRIMDYTGPGRHPFREKFDDYDLIVTTYGTLRTDIAELVKFEFDYVILDEAQAIKNAESQSAKSARLLNARSRLAISGTPIENHIGELWSILEFLNPGMLGSDTIFKRYAGASAIEGEDRVLLSKALRPFILRRTKSEVVKDLPEKTEQTLFCDMESEQRRTYDELRVHYRDALLKKDSAELNRSKIEVLEALLRLRQAACHPGLIDQDLVTSPSAKLDLLLPSLSEVVEEGHKVLVFSQFTSFLSIVRERLDQDKLVYEYLDGRTRNRAAKVDRFQNDPDCPIFLISLKAGGLGLNLTAAEYVYLLDPWWNPAVEAQAIDRSHRIGQTQHVFAYRLICRNTVEEKILELQQKKRDLADAILNADNRMISGLTRDDLEFLLS
ncbi:DEAD/DEAH box helicase [Paludisphaera mucosa]|uniref:SNF2-related protein n=1 Tax=Paludisphaera mucosa TaxID=3030827 RepID=A0ABT6FJ73_9BACT|nr:SNF2-related protein [Paludisphaera mucosa]MDG3007626.1 SNF2-related protein [Paludisphaera mucosa]